LSAILGISSEDDDDGNHASDVKKGKQDTPQDKGQGNTQGSPPSHTTGQNNGSNITQPQMKEVGALVKLKMISKDAGKAIIIKRYQKSKLESLSAKEALDLIDFLTKLDPAGIDEYLQSA